MIARLVAKGAKVGVVAQSHAVIENVMSACCAREGFDASRAVRLRGKSVTPDTPWPEVSESELVSLISGEGGLLFGGTVWDYVSERRVPADSLDVWLMRPASSRSRIRWRQRGRRARCCYWGIHSNCHRCRRGSPVPGERLGVGLVIQRYGGAGPALRLFLGRVMAHGSGAVRAGFVAIL